MPFLDVEVLAQSLCQAWAHFLEALSLLNEKRLHFFRVLLAGLPGSLFQAPHFEGLRAETNLSLGAGRIFALLSEAGSKQLQDAYSPLVEGSRRSSEAFMGALHTCMLLSLAQIEYAFLCLDSFSCAGEQLVLCELAEMLLQLGKLKSPPTRPGMGEVEEMIRHDVC